MNIENEAEQTLRVVVVKEIDNKIKTINDILDFYLKEII